MEEELKQKMIGIRITLEQDRKFESCIRAINNDSTENKVSKSLILRDCMLSFIKRVEKKYDIQS